MIASYDVVLKLRESPILSLAIASLAYLLAYAAKSYAGSPLRRYPGPWLAKFTNLWRLYHVSRGSFHHVLVRAHEKYGPVVRIGPNVLDIDYPDLNKTVFNTKGDWKKTESVLASSAMVDGHVVHNLFSQTDAAKHAREKKPIAKYYSASGVAELEPLMDKTIAQLCDELERRFVDAPGGAAGKPFDLGRWILYYTWDVVGAVTFSEPLGYLSAGRDFDGMLATADKSLDYFALCLCVPALDWWLAKNPVVRLGPAGFDPAVGNAVKHLVARYQGTDGGFHSAAQPDFLDHFIAAKSDGAADDNQIVSWLMINVLAGADTTAISIRSALYYCLKNPRVWQRLRAELAAAGLTAGGGGGVATYRDVRSVAYVDAVVREAVRMLPGVSLPIERYVPAGGVRLRDGSFVPEGAILGFNPYVLGRNREVWGVDAAEFRPERWLRGDGEAADAFAARLQAMNNADLSFGGGSRSCLGKHMGLMQVYKVVATLALRYDIALAYPDREWKVINSWFPRQEGLEAVIAKRA
ncbi:cytochrome protein [Lasiosphaeria miniovina]|uniref:Cytochrome protein n=1 Tax=Lasiosphaeria miniovina TaxID=1954250 RepID=A0AA40AKH1_9PEZI|nr:cytochrome protein [Lasiosphaeria miniovina]KAK0717508.1 cytochrome protein [Lasiosphaeria miniovina]